MHSSRVGANTRTAGPSLGHVGFWALRCTIPEKVMVVGAYQEVRGVLRPRARAPGLGEGSMGCGRAGSEYLVGRMPRSSHSLSQTIQSGPGPARKQVGIEVSVQGSPLKSLLSPTGGLLLGYGRS